MNAEKLIELLKKYADKAGYQLQTDKKHLEEVIQGLLEHQEKYGYRYCPCRVVTGDQKKDSMIICPCVYHKEEIRTMGHCHCGLFMTRPK